MMRFGLATLVLLAIGMVNGFVSNHQPLVRTCRDVSLAVGQGWDNENFLDSLSGGSDAMDDANQKYYKQTEQRGKLQEWRQQQQARHSGQELQANSEGTSEESTDDADKEDGQGGSRFKEMMEKGKQARPAATPEQKSGPILYNPMEGLSPPSPKQAPDAEASAELSMQEQAQLFQKFMQMQQQGDVAPAPSPSKPGKKVGRNRDADTIANTADVYFAQLKRDSTVRTIARYEGDQEKANAVFEDEGVKELEGMIQTNPYLKDAAKDSALLDTSADEMIAVMKLTAGNPEGNDEKVKGPSYKQKIAEKKRTKQGGAAAEPPRAQANVPEPPKAKSEPAVPETMAPPKAAEMKQSVAQAAPKTIQQQAQPAVSRPEPVTKGPGQPSVMAPPPVAPAVPPIETDDKPEVRQGLRTLMGLLLKHRGGPGFGKGRIKGDEAEGFENLLGEITELLRSEASSSGGAEVNAAIAKPAVPAPSAVPQPPQPKAVEPPAPQSVSTPPPLEQTASTEQYIPPATTMSTSSAVTYTAPGPPDERLSKTIACVEGAVQMYKNSPPEIQEGLLLPLRGALMAAVHTCNQIIAENEVENVQAYQDAVTELPKPEGTPATPGQFFEVKPYTPGGASGEEVALSETMAPEPESATPAVSTPTGTDENSIFLQTVYDSLEAASGDEKFGLGKLTSAEAVALADKVVDMKAMLIEELDTGIPAALEEKAETSSSGGGGSKYQQMLAKAKGI